MQSSAALETLSERAPAWRDLPAKEVALLLRECRSRLRAVAPRWVQIACATKSLKDDEQLAGEEWIAGIAVSIRALRLYEECLRECWPVDRLPSRIAKGKRWVSVFPLNYVDRLMMPGLRAELELEDTQAARRVSADEIPGGVAVVLGAGNIDSILVFDLLDQLVRHRRTVLLKFNPINAAISEALAEAFAPLLNWGCLRFEQGDAQKGGELVRDARVTHVHLTGSTQSFENMTRAEPPVTAQLSAELGAVTPVLVVPSAWSSEDLRFQARQVAAMAGHNASCNCNAAKLIVTARDWPQREEFLQAVREELARLPGRVAWYPGSEERWQAFREAYPHAEEIGEREDGRLPWLFVPEVPLRRSELACQREAFSPVLAEASIIARTAAEFLDRVVDPVNEEVFGTLSCAILAAPHSGLQELNRAIDRLRYGNISVNTWPGLSFGLGSPSWGAYPGHSVEDPVSGIGHVHNVLMLDRVRRSVVRAPFRPSQRPAFHPGHRQLLSLGKAWSAYEAAPSLWALLRLAWPAYRG